MQQAEFDAVARDYHSQHAASVRLSGEEPEFFSEYKVADVARAMAARGVAVRSILDFGAGIGNALPHLQNHFPEARVTCLDVSERSLDECRARALRPVDIAPYDGKAIPFADASFDLVFTACVFHHIDPADHVGLLREIRRVLSPDGRFALFEHNPWNPLTRHAVNICPFDENAILISAPEMRRRFRAAGFTDMALAYRLFFPGPLAALRPAERLLAWCPLGAQYSLMAS